MKGQTVSTMESCTGGAVVNAITNIPGASQVLKYSAVTYCNEFKIKMGVSKDVIDKYSVYSMETAREMALAITKFALSDFGIGVTGKLGKRDINNEFGDDNQVFISIYDKNLDKYSIIRVFENILSNVCKYSNGDFKVTLNEKGIITFSNKANSLDVTTVQKIFDRYFTVENAKKSTGLGLSISKQLVELNGGEISAKYVNKHLIIQIEF